MQTTAEFASNLSLFNVRRYLSYSQNARIIFLADFEQAFYNSFLVENCFFPFLQQQQQQQFITLFYKSNFIAIQPPKNYVVSCSVNTLKANLRQFSLQCWRWKESNFNRTGLHQGDLLEKFKETNLAKVSFLKLLTKDNLLEYFHQLAT